MSKPTRPADVNAGLLSRRNVLAAALWGMGGMVAVGSGWHRAFATPFLASQPAPRDFMPVSRLLTGHTLDDSLADRAWLAISSANDKFSARFADLSKAITTSGMTTMIGWATSPIAKDPALKATALAIVSAWYLGRVGEMKERSTDGPAFITYAGALMWRPTIDVTVIPTYSRGKPGFWKDRPQIAG